MRQAADHYQAYFGLPEAIAQLEAVEDLITLDVKKYSEVHCCLLCLHHDNKLILDVMDN